MNLSIHYISLFIYLPLHLSAIYLSIHYLSISALSIHYLLSTQPKKTSLYTCTSIDAIAHLLYKDTQVAIH